MVIVIDTIKLVTKLNNRLRQSEVRFDLFRENERGVITGVINPTATDRKLGVYKPRITYTERPRPHGRDYELAIELSLPKLVYGNNFNELSEADFDQVLFMLRKVLREMQIGFYFSPQLANLEVRKIDFCKNVVFTDGTLASAIIAGLNTADISKVYDVQNTDFQNGGKVLHIHTNSLDIAIYDKITDLQRSKISEKRTQEKDGYCQLNLLDELEKIRKAKHPFAVVRFEVRLNGKQKIQKEFKKLGIEEPLTFKDVFTDEVAKRVLTHHWENIFSKVQKAHLLQDTPISLLRDILSETTQRPQEALARLGYAYLSAHTNDARHIRTLFDEAIGRQAWYRIRNIRLPPQRRQLKSLIFMGNTIKEMKATKLEDYDIS
ncbi:hypothetical protein FWF48_00630 [Candidatus Saccharibacteria bacterium]|nr:hypothetical protein [Candidatus Saccharibacteria bacterium]